jgi:tetratricopeptide (TPR) repeat protein
MGGGISTEQNGDPYLLKKYGDIHFKSEQYHESIYYYTEVISCMAAENISRNFLAAVFSNRSAAFEGSGQFSAALADAERAIELAPQWPKGYFRAVKALCNFPDKLHEEIGYLDKAIALSVSGGGLPLRQLIDMRSALLRGGGSIFRGAGSVYTWGVGSYGQLGLNDLKDKALPTLVDSLRGRYVIDSACGATHTVVVLSGGEVMTWGGNQHQQCGLHIQDEHLLLPSLVPLLIGIPVVAVACGAAHTLALTQEV